jgi:hypothetical protein
MKITEKDFIDEDEHIKGKPIKLNGDLANDLVDAINHSSELDDEMYRKLFKFQNVKDQSHDR